MNKIQFLATKGTFLTTTTTKKKKKN